VILFLFSFTWQKYVMILFSFYFFYEILCYFLFNLFYFEFFNDLLFNFLILFLFLIFSFLSTHNEGLEVHPRTHCAAVRAWTVIHAFK